MEVLSATNGRQAIGMIRETSDLWIVLMDMMMPGMDGYQTMREIRVPEFPSADSRAHGEGNERRSRDAWRPARVTISPNQ